MTHSTDYRSLTQEEIAQLTAQGCRTEDSGWEQVHVRDPFVADRVRFVTFGRDVRVGRLDGDGPGGAPCLEFARLQDCTVGDHVRISRIGVKIAGYDIGDGASIEDVGLLETRPDASFGNGVEVEVLNEGGGREVRLCNSLSAQLAYLICLYRYRPRLIERLEEMTCRAADAARHDRGRIGAGAQLRSSAELIDVQVGPAAKIHGVRSLVNGTVLSESTAVTEIGAGVIARDFVIAEGARVDGAAMLDSCYIGQATRVGRQFSAEGCLWFANGEAFHGEACSLFAGPYTVTHHKSTLLIAGLFSFYNAGSGTNQSNHMYKLGPLHEGRLERGSKTGSFSYMMWPCRVGPFSVVLGKHTRAFDTGDFPFSYIEAAPDGRCTLVPGFNLTTVGTMRDGAKWPDRDRRTGSMKRDQVSFAVFSPFTVGRMQKGSDILKQLQSTTDRKVQSVAIGGAEIKRVFLRTGQKFYRRAIQMYVAGVVVDRLCQWGANKQDDGNPLSVSKQAVHSAEWVDAGGQLMPSGRMEEVVDAVESGRIETIEQLHASFIEIAHQYQDDEWAWVVAAARDLWQINVEQAAPEQLEQITDTYRQSRSGFLEAVLVDATKEFDPSSQVGFGSDGGATAVAEDFAAVRGDYNSNSFVTQLRQEIDELDQRVESAKAAIARLDSATSPRNP